MSFEGVGYYVGPLNVLTDEITDGDVQPGPVPYSIEDFGLRVLSSKESANNQSNFVTIPIDPTWKLTRFLRQK